MSKLLPVGTKVKLTKQVHSFPAGTTGRIVFSGREESPYPYHVVLDSITDPLIHDHDWFIAKDEIEKCD